MIFGLVFFVQCYAGLRPDGSDFIEVESVSENRLGHDAFKKLLGVNAGRELHSVLRGSHAEEVANSVRFFTVEPEGLEDGEFPVLVACGNGFVVVVLAGLDAPLTPLQFAQIALGERESEMQIVRSEKF